MRNANGAAESAAEVVLSFREFGRIEVVLRVHRIVAEKIECGAVKVICTGAGTEGELSARGTTVLGRIGRGQRAELLERINRDDALCGTKGAGLRCAAAEA